MVLLPPPPRRTERTRHASRLDQENGGRIVHHLKHNISRQGAHVMIVGYQARGTLGRRLVDGDPQVKIHGEHYPVRAHIHTVGGLSAHGDVEDLMRWMRNLGNRPAVHVVHGEAESKQAFRDRLEQQLGLQADVPEMGQRLEL